MQLGQLLGRKLRLMSGNLTAEISRLAGQPFGTPEQSLRLIKALIGFLKPLLHQQEGPGIFEQSFAPLAVRR